MGQMWLLDVARQEDNDHCGEKDKTTKSKRQV